MSAPGKETSAGSVKPVPTGYHTITAQLAIDGAEKAIAFYAEAFGAELVDKSMSPDGDKIWHASLRIGTSMLFVNDVMPEMGVAQSQSSMWLYVDDCDALFARAVAAGAVVKMPPADMFWGDRMGQVEDAFGQRWTIATHVKDMTPDAMKAAESAFVASMKR